MCVCVCVSSNARLHKASIGLSRDKCRNVEKTYVNVPSSSYRVDLKMSNVPLAFPFISIEMEQKEHVKAGDHLT